MKIFGIFLLIGLASASLHEMLDDAPEELVLGLLETEPSPRDFVYSTILPRKQPGAAEQLEDESETELGERLKEVLDRISGKVKDAVGEGREELLEKLKELRDKLRKIREDLGDRGKEMLDEIRKQAKDYIRKLLEKYGLNKKVADRREALSEVNYKDMLRKLKEHLKNNVDPELIKEKIEKIFDQGSEVLQMLLKTLKEKGRRRLEILVDALLGEDEEDTREFRGMQDYWDKIKDYFKDLKIDLQEKYAKFGEWAKDKFGNGLENSKDRLQNIKAIAKEFAKHAKNVSKEVGSEASEFFRQYKDELGTVWEELKEAFKQIRNREE